MTPQQYTQGFEGLRLQSYDDATGFPLNTGDVPKGTCTIGYGSTGPDIIPGLIWTKAQCDARFASDYALAAQNAERDLGLDYWDGIGALRQMALTDMCYQEGGGGVAQFHLMLQALRDQDWEAAHDQCIASLYDRQVPHRAGCNAEIFLTGEWPAGMGENT